MKPCNDGGTHHYLLEEASGKPEIPGRCKKCGHERTWKASLDIDAENAQWQTNKLRHLFTGYDPERKDTRIL